MKKHLIMSVLALMLLAMPSCQKEEVKHPCYDANLENSHNGQCIEINFPVCGCNGQTYLNECKANLEGFEVAYNGACR